MQPSRFIFEIPSDCMEQFVPAPFVKPETTATSYSYKEGDRVHHDKQGVGTVSAVQELPDKKYVFVRFDSTGSTIKLIATHPSLKPFAEYAAAEESPF